MLALVVATQTSLDCREHSKSHIRIYRQNVIMMIITYCYLILFVSGNEAVFFGGWCFVASYHIYIQRDRSRIVVELGMVVVGTQRSLFMND